ncbi:Crinkler (CRN) family protein [Planoprotostelium fungivorum]|uniref:Crinkler (CRN) family protein n=1 Tax=Planoprotostelium fungivorum TaxID=1890364 RepID=A0A2P6MWC6_9EUKA|nr:Crinkler (CRN) family protein [Planoprotostelium fungivorum]
MVIQKRKRLDIWTPSKRTLVDSTEFKDSLISYYDRKDPRSSDIKCMVLDRFYPRDKVRGSHIWKYATYGEGLDEFGLKEDDVNKERNGLLLGEGIELAFDNFVSSVHSRASPGSLQTSQALARIAAALEFVSAVVLRDNELIFLLTLTLEFKNSLISYYDRKDPRSSDIKCMVLDRFYPRDKVRGSHIWKYATYGEGLDEFGLKEDDVNKERNGLLLGEGIELAFDSKQLCFLYDPINTKFIVKVLDPGLLQSSTPVSPSQTRTFSDINNLPLCLPAGRSPFRRLLSWHAECTYTTALKKTWIDQPAFDTFTTYDNLSNGARPDFLEDLDNEE